MARLTTGSEIFGRHRQDNLEFKVRLGYGVRTGLKTKTRERQCKLRGLAEVLSVLSGL